ncbi:MAG: hypothetical protein ABEI07_00490, partial [Candidatus Nanohaloarchaea archaeon]
MSEPEKSLEVENVLERDGELSVTFRNDSADRIYDVMKLYLDDRYAGFEYVDVDPHESEDVIFELGSSGIEDSDRIVLTTNSREDGVVEEVSQQEIESLQDQEESDEHPERELEGGAWTDRRDGETSPEESLGEPPESRSGKEETVKREYDAGGNVGEDPGEAKETREPEEEAGEESSEKTAELPPETNLESVVNSERSVEAAGTGESGERRETG